MIEAPEQIHKGPSSTFLLTRWQQWFYLVLKLLFFFSINAAFFSVVFSSLFFSPFCSHVSVFSLNDLWVFVNTETLLELGFQLFTLHFFLSLNSTHESQLPLPWRRIQSGVRHVSMVTEFTHNWNWNWTDLSCRLFFQFSETKLCDWMFFGEMHPGSCGWLLSFSFHFHRLLVVLTFYQRRKCFLTQLFNSFMLIKLSLTLLRNMKETSEITFIQRLCVFNENIQETRSSLWWNCFRSVNSVNMIHSLHMMLSDSKVI